jgi:Ca2+-binding RTX toxin-like protein
MIGGSGNDALVAFNSGDFLTGGAGNDTFVFHHGDGGQSTVTDFGADGADQLVFLGYGSAADGASFVQVDATHWSVNSADGLAHDVIAFSNAAAIHAYDYLFA